MAIRKVAMVGASGRLGPSVLKQLLDASFEMTVLNRASSKATYPPSVRVVTIPDNLNVDDLADALEGQDALVITLAGTKREESIRLVDAAIKARVRRVIPADFGSGDSADSHAQQLVPGYAAKAQVRAYLEEVAAGNEWFSWTSVLCGHFFDWGLSSGFLHFDIKNRTADIFDDGEVKWSTSTLSRIGEAVVQVLRKEELTKNRMLYIQSFCVSQFDILETLQKQTGQDWTVSFVKSGEYLQAEQEKHRQGDSQAIEEIVLVHGILTSNWEGKENFAMSLLDLQQEDLDQVVRKVIESTYNIA